MSYVPCDFALRWWFMKRFWKNKNELGIVMGWQRKLRIKKPLPGGVIRRFLGHPLDLVAKVISFENPHENQCGEHVLRVALEWYFNAGFSTSSPTGFFP